MVDCYNREVQGLDDVEIWIHTCWGNPNMQRVMEDTSYRASFELYLHAMKGDVWTIETRDRDFQDIELFGQLKGRLPKKICIGAVSHRNLQADRPADVANAIRGALKHIAPEQLIVSSDCGFGRQGCNREIAFYKASAIAQGCNIVRQEIGLPASYIPAADPALQMDIVPKTARSRLTLVDPATDPLITPRSHRSGTWTRHPSPPFVPGHPRQQTAVLPSPPMQTG